MTFFRLKYEKLVFEIMWTPISHILEEKLSYSGPSIKSSEDGKCASDKKGDLFSTIISCLCK